MLLLPNMDNQSEYALKRDDVAWFFNCSYFYRVMCFKWQSISCYSLIDKLVPSNSIFHFHGNMENPLHCSLYSPFHLSYIQRVCLDPTFIEVYRCHFTNTNHWNKLIIMPPKSSLMYLIHSSPYFDTVEHTHNWHLINLYASQITNYIEIYAKSSEIFNRCEWSPNCFCLFWINSKCCFAYFHSI